MDLLTTTDGSFTWTEFEAAYWRSQDSFEDGDETGLFYQLSADSEKSASVREGDTILFPNRRCFDSDYSELWRDDVWTGKGGKLENANPPFCNNEDYELKPRTWRYGGSSANSERSLFPMATRTRAEALARSNSAYFISIIIVQWADLMICKTRVRSLFEL